MRGRLSTASSRAAGRVRGNAWPLVQTTAAATAAWLLAKYVFDHHEPFFAPIAALVALNTVVGERGLNAVRLLQGVVLGIVVGELVLAALGDGSDSLAVAVLAALFAASALGGERLVLAQAAIGAILTVTVGDPDAGLERLADALVGAGVALAFSQLLFAPRPLRLLRRAETAALTEMAAALRLTARSLERDDDALGAEAITKLRDLRDRLADLRRTRTASERVARRTLRGRRDIVPVVRETEDAGHLDLLGVSCLALTRTAVGATSPQRRAFANGIAELANVLTELSESPGALQTRERAVERALEAARDIATAEIAWTQDLSAILASVRMATTDLLVFAGVEADEANRAVLSGTTPPDVAEPAASQKGALWRLLRRAGRSLRGTRARFPYPR